MKKILIPFILFAGIVGYVSCQKEHSNDPAPVAAEKTEGIKKGEPVVFSVGNLSGQSADWAVSPAANVRLTANGNTATILFGKAGSYLVTANTGGSVARITVNVSDSIYCDSTGHCYDSTWNPHDSVRNCIDSNGVDTCRGGTIRDTTLSLRGDSIHITPALIDSGSISGLLINATTMHKYPCTNNYLQANVISAGSEYVIKYEGVRIYGTCVSGQAKSKTTNAFFPVQDGTHVFKVLLNGATYTGSFTKSGNQFSFNWPYTSGVTISPKTIN